MTFLEGSLVRTRSMDEAVLGGLRGLMTIGLGTFLGDFFVLEKGKLV